MFSCNLYKKCGRFFSAAIFFVTVLFQPVCALSDPNKPYSYSADFEKKAEIKEVVIRAVNWHPSIAMAASDLKNKQQFIDVAKAAYYPQVNAGLRGGYDSSQPENRSNPSAVLSVSQMLYDFGKTKHAVAAEKSSTLISQAALLSSIDEIIKQTLTAALEMQRYRFLINAATDMELGIAALADLVQQRHVQGAGTKSDLVQSYAKLEAAKARKIEYQTQIERWKSRIYALTGEYLSDVSGMDEKLTSIDCQTIDIDESVMPQLIRARAERTKAHAQLKTAAAQQMPTLTLDPAVRHYLDERPYTGSVMDDRTRYEVHLNFNMPLYQGGSLRARQDAAQYALESADAMIENAKIQAQQLIMEAVSQQSFLVQHREVLQYREQLSKETRDLYRQQYIDLGNRSLLDLLNAEQDIHLTKIDQYNLLFDQQKIKVECAATGGLMRKLFSLDSLEIHGVDVRP